MVESGRPPAQDPHHGQPVRLSGVPLQSARAALLMLHGRGARAEDILSLTAQLDLPGFTYLAPQAAGDTWYPNRFSAPLDSNQPWLFSALAFVGAVLTRIGAAGIPPERTLLLGFSQGACLALEFAARNAHRYGGLVGLSGALIGPEDAPRQYAGSLAGTPVFLGCSDVDIHVPKERVQQTAEVLKRLGGQVTLQLYANMDHSASPAELDFVRRMMQAILPAS
jgi:phospholipase/carboxylesterase